MDYGTKHLMYLMKRDKGCDGWTKVSSQIWPLVEQLPKELVELQKTERGGFARLTKEGEAVLAWA